MKKLLLVCVCTIHFIANAQLKNDLIAKDSVTLHKKYISINPLILLEQAMPIGIGFGNHFSLHSEYFAELSYLGKNPIYEWPIDLHGGRAIFQYRYHVFHWRNLGDLRHHHILKEDRINKFFGVEFRVKAYNFTEHDTIVNEVTNNTIQNFVYGAKATIISGALFVGATYNFSKNGKWKIETTAGIGAKVKRVDIKNMPNGYEILKIYKTDPGIPGIYEETRLPYFPIAIRLRYYFN